MARYRASFWSAYGEENSIETHNLNRVRDWILKQIERGEKNCYDEIVRPIDFEILEIASEIDAEALCKDAD